MAYKKVEIECEAVEYTGDIQALLDFGVTKIEMREFKDVHVSITCCRGKILCAKGDYVVKDQFGNIDVVAKKDFTLMYTNLV